MLQPCTFRTCICYKVGDEWKTVKFILRRRKSRDILRYIFRIAIRHIFFVYCDRPIYLYIVTTQLTSTGETFSGGENRPWRLTAYNNHLGLLILLERNHFYEFLISHCLFFDLWMKKHTLPAYAIHDHVLYGFTVYITYLQKLITIIVFGCVLCQLKRLCDAFYHFYCH